MSELMISSVVKSPCAMARFVSCRSRINREMRIVVMLERTRVSAGLVGPRY